MNFYDIIFNYEQLKTNFTNQTDINNIIGVVISHFSQNLNEKIMNEETSVHLSLFEKCYDVIKRFFIVLESSDNPHSHLMFLILIKITTMMINFKILFYKNINNFKNIKKIKLDSLSNINLVQLIKDYKELYDINEHFMNTINKVTNNFKMFIKRRFSNYFNFTQINEFLLTNHTEKELDNMIYEVLNMVPDMAENRKIVPFKQILVDIFKDIDYINK